MPSIHRSQHVDTSMLRAASTNRPADLPHGEVAENYAQVPRSPYMLTSMPLVASTGDLLTRQFASGTRVPSQRILPPAARRTT